MAGSSRSGTIGAGKLTYDDLVTLPEDGKRYEILDGELAVTPPPLTKHQIVSANLGVALYNHVRQAGLGTVLFAPTGVILDEHTIVEPDILFVRAQRAAIIERHAIVGAPDLLVEILSRSTASRDRGAKAKLYARFGVDHYWIVDAERQTLESFTRAGTGYESAIEYSGQAIVTVPPFDNLALDLGVVWE